MKSLSLITACALFTISALAQAPTGGSVQFLNRVVGVVDQKIFDVDGTTPLAGAAFKAQLFGGPANAAEGSLAAVGLPTVFREGAGAGYLAPGADYFRYIPTVTAGDAATLQVRVWDAAYADFDAAYNAGAKAGKSDVFAQAKTGNAGSPPSPAEPMVNFKSFSVQIIPEPSTIALGLLGASMLLIRRRK